MFRGSGKPGKLREFHFAEFVSTLVWWFSCFTDVGVRALVVDRQGGKPGAMQPCRTCRGSGVKVTMRPLGPGMVQQVQAVCPDCSGEG